MLTSNRLKNCFFYFCSLFNNISFGSYCWQHNDELFHLLDAEFLLTLLSSSWGEKLSLRFCEVQLWGRTRKCQSPMSCWAVHIEYFPCGFPDFIRHQFDSSVFPKVSVPWISPESMGASSCALLWWCSCGCRGNVLSLSLCSTPGLLLSG